MTRNSCASFLIGQFRPDVRAHKLQVHQPRRRDSGVPPLRHGGRRYVTHASYGGSAAELVDFLGVGVQFAHDSILTMAKITVNSHG